MLVGICIYGVTRVAQPTWTQQYPGEERRTGERNRPAGHKFWRGAIVSPQEGISLLSTTASKMKLLSGQILCFC